MVLYNVPESLSEERVDRMKENKEMFHTLYDVKEEEFNDKDIKVMHRVGGKDALKPRPMIVKFKDNKTKTTYLKQSRDLALTVDDELVRIYAAHDRTKEQKEKMKKLSSEGKERKSKVKQILLDNDI